MKGEGGRGDWNEKGEEVETPRIRWSEFIPCTLTEEKGGGDLIK